MTPSFFLLVSKYWNHYLCRNHSHSRIIIIICWHIGTGVFAMHLEYVDKIQRQMFVFLFSLTSFIMGFDMKSTQIYRNMVVNKWAITTLKSPSLSPSYSNFIFIQNQSLSSVFVPVLLLFFRINNVLFSLYYLTLSNL